MSSDNTGIPSTPTSGNLIPPMKGYSPGTFTYTYKYENMPEAKAVPKEALKTFPLVVGKEVISTKEKQILEQGQRAITEIGVLKALFPLYSRLTKLTRDASGLEKNFEIWEKSLELEKLIENIQVSPEGKEGDLLTIEKKLDEYENLIEKAKGELATTIPTPSTPTAKTLTVVTNTPPPMSSGAGSPPTPPSTPPGVPLDVYGTWPPYIYFDKGKGKGVWMFTLDNKNKRELPDTAEWTMAEVNIRKAFDDYIAFITEGGSQNRQKKIALCTSLIQEKNAVIEALKEEDPTKARVLAENLQRNIEEWKVNFPKLLLKDEIRKDFEKKQKGFEGAKDEIVKHSADIVINTVEKEELRKLEEDIATYASEIQKELGGSKGVTQNLLDAYQELLAKHEDILKKFREKIMSRGYRGSVLRPIIPERKDRQTTLMSGATVDQEVWDGIRSWDRAQEDQKVEQAKTETQESLTQKHQRMFDDNPEKYRELYQGKKFIDGDLEGPIVRGLLGDQPAQETGPTTPQSQGIGDDYAKSLDLTNKKALRQDESIRQQGIDKILQTDGPLTEAAFQGSSYVPAGNSLRYTSEKDPAFAVPNKREPPHVEPIIETTPPPLPQADTTGKIEPHFGTPPAPEASAPQPERPTDNLEARNRRVGAVAGKLTRQNGGKWQKFLWPLVVVGAMGGTAGYMAYDSRNERPTSPEATAPKIPTTQPQEVVKAPERANVGSVGNMSVMGWRDYIPKNEQVDLKSFLEDFEATTKSGDYTEFLIKRLPLTVDRANPATLQKVLSIDGSEVLSTRGAYGLTEAQQTEISKFIASLSDIAKTTSAVKRYNAIKNGLGENTYPYEAFSRGIIIKDFMDELKKKIATADTENAKSVY